MSLQKRSLLLAVLFIFAAAFIHPLFTSAETTPEQRGLHNLTSNPYGTPLLNAKLIAALQAVWEPEWKAKVTPDDPESVQRVAFERYGFSPATWPNQGAPLQLVATQGGWVQSCMLCHGGRLPISGESKIGMPNTELDMQTLYEDVTKLTGLRNSFPMSFAMSRGRTNAFVFSLELLRRRNEDLSRRADPLPMGQYSDYDLDAPSWWYLKKKTALYSDGSLRGDFTRPIMQFTMGEPSGEKIRSWEGDFRDILAYLRSIEAPKYPLAIDKKLAGDGERVFASSCSRCHGTYGPTGKYPNLIVPIDMVRTDSLRLTALTREFREYFNKTWFAGGSSHAEEKATGFVAPPLDGVWASAPYFHNGSVPTIYGVLTQEARPKYFRRVGGAKEYDSKDVGLKFEALTAPPDKALPGEVRRRVVDTTLPGLGNGGHEFGFALSEREKRQVIEYLKTL
jgi:cytochrome c553